MLSAGTQNKISNAPTYWRSLVHIPAMPDPLLFSSWFVTGLWLKEQPLERLRGWLLAAFSTSS